MAIAAAQDSRVDRDLIYRVSTGVPSGDPGYSERELQQFLELKQREVSSRTLQLEAVFSVLYLELEAVSAYRDNWDSYGAPAPTPDTVRLARKLLAQAREQLVQPTTVVASAEGGIAIYFMRGSRTCYIEFQNGGECVLGMYSDDGPSAVVEELQDSDEVRRRALKSVREYLIG